MRERFSSRQPSPLWLLSRQNILRVLSTDSSRDCPEIIGTRSASAFSHHHPRQKEDAKPTIREIFLPLRVVEHAPTTPCACRKRTRSSLGPPPQGEGVQICPPHTPPTPLPPRGGVTQTKKLRAPLVGAQGYQSFPLSKPVAGQHIALHAVLAYRASPSS